MEVCFALIRYDKIEVNEGLRAKHLKSHNGKP